MRFPRFHFGTAIALGLSCLCMSSVPVFADGPVNRDVDDCTDLQNMEDILFANYTLTADIDCDGVDFTPVGTSVSPFTGTLNGSGFTVSNLTIDTSEADYGGLFGYTSNAEISNIILENVTVSAGDYAGALAGFARGSTFENVAASGVTLTVGNDAGGLVGHLTNGSMSGAYAIGVSYEAGEDNSGGLIGTFSGGTVMNVFALHENMQSSTNVGGVVGLLYAGIDTVLRNAYADGSLEGGGRVGGLVGYMNVSAGFAGVCSVENSFSAGGVEAGNIYAALIGVINAACSITNSATSIDESCVGGGGDDSGCTQVDEDSEFYDAENEPLASWDFASVWYERSSDFPALRWSNTSVNPVTSAAAAVSGDDVTLSWVNPVDADFVSVTIRRSTDGFPATVTDGTSVASGITGTSTTDNDLSNGTYYYSLFALDDPGNISAAATVSATVSVSSSSSSSSSQPRRSGGGGTRSSTLQNRKSLISRIFGSSSSSRSNNPNATLLEIRTCERVRKLAKGNDMILSRVNKRLQNRFGFTCGK